MSSSRRINETKIANELYKQGFCAKDESVQTGLFEAAAEKGHTDAQSLFACRLEVGQGVEKNESRAVEMFTKAARNGDSFSQWKLARMLQEGRGVSKNAVVAFQWLKRAAEKGCATAQYFLGDATRRRSRHNGKRSSGCQVVHKIGKSGSHIRSILSCLHVL